MTDQPPIAVSGGLRTQAEQEEGARNQACFERNPSSWESKMENFPKYVRRQNITRFLSLYEIFKLALPIKGSVVECGVNHGFGIMTWVRLSAILEPVNLTRRIYGFDTFEGFPSLSEQDRAAASDHVKIGDLFADSHDELLELASINDSTRFLGHVPKVKLIKGDATRTIPDFVRNTPHLLVSLLYLDFDLYEPTKVALENFLPRMPKGAIIAFDELDNPLWPGETVAMLEVLDKYKLRIQRLPFDPYVGFAEVC
ncbi:dTDP-6-deoxy-L-hexose 3-O-methyltransferase [Steroidobacter denitrificans]|uniref:dTDP-6-deoxy-L-hexose 3-O-methyltransferase n=1 Tax=Steroidobacter denitrificans TaxID=465721 RepID=A0A127FA05_STEDE|nr:class I SAM-dependent methyltransferase [Steroidobacter denitrificans]AMN46435.1 dTDP-6-deoxy-L-hexose 3-O-methyltransferase [Steroidobacter denitrificans]